MIGVYCSSNRPEYWRRMYYSLSQNNVEFNLCIAGPYPPLYDLPVNVKYIQTNVKPSQCFFIAACNVNGDILYHVGDDTVLDAGTLDTLYDIMKENDENTIATAKWVESQHEIVYYRWGEDRRYVVSDFPMPVGAMIHRKTFMDIGVDKNFLALRWDEDIAQELIRRGGKTILDSHHMVIEIAADVEDHRISMSAIQDYTLYLHMWLQPNEDGTKIVLRKQRAKPIEPLVYSLDILTVSQGARDERWT